MAFTISSASVMAIAFAFLSSSLLPLIYAQQQQPRAQSRSPHGLIYENPVAFPPDAFDFFHPNTRPAHNGAPLPMAGFPEITSKARADPVYTWPAPPHGGGIGAGGAAAAVVGGVFFVLSAAGAFYVVMRRRAKPVTGGGDPAAPEDA